MESFYMTDEELQNSPSRKDGIDVETELTLRFHGCELIQESGILLRLPQAAMATGQVMFHRFYCKRSFGHFDVRRIAASCIWVASKHEECPRQAEQVVNVFYRMECRRQNLAIKQLDKKMSSELKEDLIRAERQLLKEVGFICRVELPHKFILNYLAALRTPPELRQEAWNLANDGLRTTLCVRFKSEVIACGVVYAAARRFRVPLPENPPWWKVFDTEKWEIDEVCRVLACLYSRPKAEYIPICKGAQAPPVTKHVSCGTTNSTVDTGAAEAVPAPTVPDKLENLLSEGEGRGDKPKPEPRARGSGERIWDRDREREKLKSRDHERRVDSDRKRDRAVYERGRSRTEDRKRRSGH